MNAKEFAKLAAQISQIADQLKPADKDPYANAQNLAVTYMRMAATQIRSVAEAKAIQEGNK